ncbi:hypothetical protein MNBD_GAMMA11-1668 [hydrothermal vent metagenome]|uniref:DUF2970 domain-containing protein n=1 Tax=hydrothermal vent metagenome TaxID=652676 RepID=A0A3B0XCV4_9ZZZZ
MTDDGHKTDERKGTGLLNIIKSTVAAACGIQTNSNRVRDFENGKPSTFIIAGLVFVTIFILSMYGIVQLVMSLAAP